MTYLQHTLHIEFHFQLGIKLLKYTNVKYSNVGVYGRIHSEQQLTGTLQGQSLQYSSR